MSAVVFFYFMLLFLRRFAMDSRASRRPWPLMRNSSWWRWPPSRDPSECKYLFACGKKMNAVRAR